MEITVKRFAGLLALLILFFAPASSAQQPTIARNGVLNGASYALPGLPNAGIAQGSIFVVFGQNLGPASLVQVSSFPLPTSQGLAGTSIRVTVGGTSLNAIMLYTSASQVAAVLPSNTPLGNGLLTITYNNQTSASVAVTVVPGSFGIFALNQAGSGPGVIQNFNSESDAPFNSVTEAARPGQVEILWGTGLGPVAGNEAAQPLPGDLTNVNVRVLVGGREARVLYRGRSGCCVGVDQVNFEVPQGIEGCYVPVSVQIGNVVSNFASMSISSSGKVCSDPFGFTVAELEAARLRGTFRIGNIGLARTSIKIAEPGLPATEFKLDVGAAAFENFSFSRFTQSQLEVSSLGTCLVHTFRADAEFEDPVTGTGLEAGAVINVSGPRGSRQLTRQAPGLYSGQLSDLLNPLSGGYLDAGIYSLNNGSGGAGTSAVGPFQVSHTIPPALQWLNESSITTVNRAQGVQVTWSGGDPNSFVEIAGVAVDPSKTAAAVFVCAERASAGSFTVPAAVLLALPATGATGEAGFLFVGSFTTPTRFTATGLDLGYVVSLDLIGKEVAYQ